MTPTITATANFTEEDDVINPPGPPHTYFGAAKSFLSGAVALVDAPNCALSLAFLAAQSAECGLKAYLSRNGDDSRLIKPKIRHNLVLLWSEAQQEGLSVAAVPPPWLLALSQLHDRPYYLRYSKGIGAIVTPASEATVFGLSALIEQISQQLN